MCDIISVKTDGPESDSIQGNNEGDMNRADTPHAMVDTSTMSVVHGNNVNVDVLSRPGTPHAIARLTSLDLAQSEFEQASHFATTNTMARLSALTNGQRAKVEDSNHIATPSGRINPVSLTPLEDNDNVFGAACTPDTPTGLMDAARVTALKAWVANGQTSGRHEGLPPNEDDFANSIFHANEEDMRLDIVHIDENPQLNYPNGLQENDQDSGYDNGDEGQQAGLQRSQQRPPKSPRTGVKKRRARTAIEIEEKRREREERQEEFRTKHTRIMSWLDDCIDNLQDGDGEDESSVLPTMQTGFEMCI